MLFDIELSKEEVLLLESYIEHRPPQYIENRQQTAEILAQKIKFMKLQIQGHGLEAAAKLLHLEEVPEYAPERADAWHDISESLEKDEKEKNWRDISPCADCEWGMNTPSV